MDRRVFLSSTYDDLKGYRDAVLRSIRQLGARTDAMEEWGARDDRPLEESRRMARECDAFVGIYAYRYGFVPKGEERSITELEYIAATESRRKRFIYLLHEDACWIPAHIERGRGERRLKAFKSRLQKEHVYQWFRTSDELAAKVAADLGRHFVLETMHPSSQDQISQRHMALDFVTWRNERNVKFKQWDEQFGFRTHRFDATVFATDEVLDSIVSVTYTLPQAWADYGSRCEYVIKDRRSRFRLSELTFGEFFLYAEARLNTGAVVPLSCVVRPPG